MLVKSVEERVLDICNKSRVPVAPYLLATAEIGKPSANGVYMIPRNLLEKADPNRSGGDLNELASYVEHHGQGMEVLAPVSIFGIPKIWMERNGVDTGTDSANIDAVAGSWLIAQLVPLIQEKKDDNAILCRIFDIICPDADKDRWISKLSSLVDFWRERYAESKEQPTPEDPLEEMEGKESDKHGESSGEDSEVPEVPPKKDSKKRGSGRRKPKQ